MNQMAIQMSSKIKVFLIVLFVVALLSRIIPALGYNFYFTMDQANDAVNVREIIERGRFLLLGPETGIKNVYAGPGWYYFISLGYFLFRGDPLGGLLMVILLNSILLLAIAYFIYRRLGFKTSFLVSFLLLFDWSFYDTSRYAFNPFPLVFLSFAMIYFLEKQYQEKSNFIIAAWAMAGLAFHFEVAGAMALSIFCFFITLHQSLIRKINYYQILYSLLIFSLFFTPHLINEFSTGFGGLRALFDGGFSEGGVLTSTNYFSLFKVIISLITTAIIPQSTTISIAIFISLPLFFLHKRKASQVSFFIGMVYFLTLISYLWFGSNQGWQTWHTIYLPPLITVATCITLFFLPRKIGLLIWLLIFSSQTIYFSQEYRRYFRPSGDQSLLVNEIKAVDWVYQQSAGSGFQAYIYLPSIYDYPYQYLFWWYGRRRYGYLPCEFSTFPKSTQFYVPGYEHYSTPAKPCGNQRYLIIEPDQNQYLRDLWLSQLTEKTSMVATQKVGNIELRKLEVLK